MKINFVSKTDNFFLKKPPEHVECNSHSHDGTFLSKYQKTFLQPWKTGKRAFLPKTGFLLKKTFWTTKMQFWQIRQRVFCQKCHGSCSKSGKRLWRNLLFQKDKHYPGKCPLGKWNGNFTILPRTIRRKQNLFLEIRKGEKTKSAPKIILFEKLRWTPRLLCDKPA